MAEGIVSVDLVAEDSAHESTARALITRCAREEGVDASVRIVSARLGIPRLRQELKALRRVRQHGAGPVPDVLVVLIDANRVGVAERRREVEQTLDTSLFPAVVIGVPDPYVERWLLADPVSFAETFGVTPQAPRRADRRAWKHALVTALEASDEFVVAGSEFAQEIVDGWDLYRAGHGVPSLGAFLDDLRLAFRTWARDQP